MDTAYNLPPIFVISLKNSPRREFMTKRLSGLGLQFEFLMRFMEKISLRLN